MATLKVTAPVSDYSGTVGPVQFQDGAAEFDPKEHPGVLSYFLGAGYNVAGYETNPEPPGLYAPRPKPTAPAPGTPDNPTGVVGGVPPRDAAVVPDADGPWSDAFLPPTNAGKADPHGPDVVSPGLHAVPPAPIRPGEVFVDDLPRQEAEETRLASEVLSEGKLVTDVVPTFEGPPAGPLGLSDPGSVEMGERAAAELREAGVPTAADLAERRDAAAETPARRATVEEWRAHATARGATDDELEGLTKAELIERYG